MTVGRPLYLDGITNYTADEFRTMFDSLYPAAGVLQDANISNLGVVPTGPVSMAVQVGTGFAVVPAKSAANGKYLLEVTAPETVTIAAASAQNRIDIIVAQVLDTAFSDASNTAQIVSIAGTPSGSPVAPATPSNAVLLATVAVNTGAATIVAGNITDKRQVTAAAGGIITCVSQAQRDALVKIAGRTVYRFDTKTLETCDGTTWTAVRARAGGRATTTAAQSIGAGTLVTLTNNGGANVWTATEDSGGYVSATGGTATPLVVPTGKGGLYAVGGRLVLAAASSGRLFFQILVNGAGNGDRMGLPLDSIASGTIVLPLNAGDTLGIQAFTATATTISVGSQIYAYRIGD